MAKLELMSGGLDAKKHIVFIHGLGGDYLSTWQSGSSDKVFWPNWLNEDVPDVNVWSVAYEAPKFSFLELGMGLKDRALNIYELLLTEAKFASGELILIGHSLGGLIIKQVLRLASDESEHPEAVEFVNRVTGVGFLGTPHAGAKLVEKGNSFLGKLLLLPLYLLSSPSTASLAYNDPNLRELNSWYRAWCKKKNIRHLILGENKRTYRLFMIVKPDSADPGLSESAIPIDKNHIDISKPPSRGDEVYRHILNFVSKDTLSNQDIWLRAKFGLNTTGWKGYENWASCSKEIEEEYIVDEAIRLYDHSLNKSEGLTGLDAINILRQRLFYPKTSLRLVGLSGVGKTRFVQALFDKRIGVCALPQESVFYTDMSFSPTPNPRILLEKLIFDAKPSIVIVDNCPPNLHAILTTLLYKQNGSTVSLLTVEYDVREDRPEATDVFSLEPSSPKLIEKMLEARFDYLSQQDVRTITEFSGGNARIANLLASTIEKGEQISQLKDTELFKRLFHQRHDNSENLEKTAKALALVYSFQIESEEGYSSDITLLSQLAHLSPQELYESAQELKRRQLAQQRSIWMAILPHPIANKLACTALQNIPIIQISNLINQGSDARILKSFSRRLGYLNDSEEARTLACSWLADESMLDLLYANPKDGLTYTLLSNIAPIIPKATLQYLKRQADRDNTNTFLTRNNPSYIEITRLLRSLAYDKEHFSESVELLCRFAINEKEGENNNSIRDLLSSLFQLYLSGTHAEIEQRLCIINQLTRSACLASQIVGLELLDAALEANHFSSGYGFAFGANSRDFGYEPKNAKEIETWYITFINFCASLIKSNPQLGERVKDVLSKHFRSLWKYSRFHDLLEKISFEVSSTGGWVSGWEAIGSALRYNSKSMSEESKQRLINIKHRLLPHTHEDLMQLYVLPNHFSFSGLDELDEDGNILKYGIKKAEEFAEDIGYTIVSGQFEYFQEILPVVLIAEVVGTRTWNFGVGCAKGASDPVSVWALIVKCSEGLDIKKINTYFLKGYVKHFHESSYEQAQVLLNDLLDNSKLNYIFPLVQLECPLDENAMNRIKQALINKTSPSWMYQFGCYDSIPDSELISILDLLWQQTNGQGAVVKILMLRFCRLGGNKSYSPSDKLIDKGRTFLLNFNYRAENCDLGEIDYDLSRVAKICFASETALEKTKEFFKKLLDEILSDKVPGHKLKDLLAKMVKIKPFIALETFINPDGSAPPQIKSAFKKRISGKTSPFSDLSLNDAVSWCEENPHQRFKGLALLITPYNDIEDSYQWTPLAMELLEKSPEPTLILDIYRNSFTPMTWFGSRASMLEQRTSLLQTLTEHPNAVISQHAKKQLEEWNNFVSAEREREVIVLHICGHKDKRL